MPARFSRALFARRLSCSSPCSLHCVRAARRDRRSPRRRRGESARLRRASTTRRPTTSRTRSSFDHATGVSASTYTNNTKLVEIARPWKDADETFRVLLVQCGTPAPDDVDADVTIEVPVRRVATFSTTQLPSFALLDQADAIVAHGGLQYVVDARGRRGRGGAAPSSRSATRRSPTSRRCSRRDPDVALLSAGVDGDAHRTAIDAVGVPAVPYADWLEEIAAGPRRVAEGRRAADQQRAAARTSEFAQIEQRLRRRHRPGRRASTTHPKVVLGAPFEGTWFMPAGDSYVAAALTALGAEYPWAETEGTGALSLDIETVIDKAADADLWIGAGSVRGTHRRPAGPGRALRGLPSRCAAARCTPRTARSTTAGGNALFELGAVRPDLVLADLFKILYPERRRGHRVHVLRARRRAARRRVDDASSCACWRSRCSSSRGCRCRPSASTTATCGARRCSSRLSACWSRPSASASVPAPSGRWAPPVATVARADRDGGGDRRVPRGRPGRQRRRHLGWLDAASGASRSCATAASARTAPSR